jgi:sortase A
MSHIQTLEPVGATEPSPERRGRVRRGRVLRFTGLVLIAAGLAVGGYVWWLLWGTSFITSAAQDQIRAPFERLIGTTPPEDAPAADRVVKVPGAAVAILRIPDIEVNYVVVEGTDTESLRKGPGHYTWTSYPWEDTGTVGIAGHRTTYGAPFWSLDELTRDDRIVLATEYGIFNYRVTHRALIDPSDASVLDPSDKPTLVLTTCNPRFSATQRLVVFADRVG